MNTFLSSSQEAPVSPEPALQNTIRLLARLGREKWFGKVTLSIEAGSVTLIRKEETLKPNELAR